MRWKRIKNHEKQHYDVGGLGQSNRLNFLPKLFTLVTFTEEVLNGKLRFL